MEFKKLGLSEAAERMVEWKQDSDSYMENRLDPDYRDLREDLVKAFQDANTGHKYSLDCQFGLMLNLVLARYEFTLRDASDDGIWRYLSMCVVPDLIAKRWGKGAEIRYYKQASRMWLKTIWWYIHLSWQGSSKDTIHILASNSTDQILQLVDRSGAKGYYVKVYRSIMYYYWKARQINPEVGETEFRRVMTLHTALCKSIEPDFFAGGYDGYVRMLFNRIGVELGNEHTEK